MLGLLVPNSGLMKLRPVGASTSPSVSSDFEKDYRDALAVERTTFLGYRGMQGAPT